MVFDSQTETIPLILQGQRGTQIILVRNSGKLGIAIWDYLGSRFKVAGHAIIEPLDHYVRARFRPA
jgi:hypothetical protein